MPAPLSLRTRAAVLAGHAASSLSRLTGRGEGLVISGRVIERVSPDALRELAGDRVAALVSATNGKSSTTRLLATAVGGPSGAVATQQTGANMTDGVISALSDVLPPVPAVLEVDEAYLPEVVAGTEPKAVVLGNLTRDQLDRMNEVGMLARKWRAMLATCPAGTVVVANCDDPVVTWAAAAAPRVVWVAAGQNWTADAGVCLGCGALMVFDEAGWHCSGCEFARPEPTWRFERAVAAGSATVARASDGGSATEAIGAAAGADDSESFRAVGPPGEFDLSDLGLPGWFNAANATLALAAATDVLGLDPAESVGRMRTVRAVSGRYEVRRIGELNVRLLLAKNPASWTELLTVMPPAPAPVIITINANDADGRDPSWLWDVPFERLRGRQVVATGERRFDLAVRLLHAGVDHVVIDDPYAPGAPLPEGVRDLPFVDCAATYTAFHGLRTRADARTDAPRRGAARGRSAAKRGG